MLSRKLNSFYFRRRQRKTFFYVTRIMRFSKASICSYINKSLERAVSSNMDNCENSAADGVQWSDKRVSPDVCVCFAYIYIRNHVWKKGNACFFLHPAIKQARLMMMLLSS
jgi:hypothetical protein